MATVSVQDVSCNDLPWMVTWRQDKCVLCGMCAATCTADAIHFVPSRGGGVRGVALRQRADMKYVCTGCGMCRKVCPQDAVQPVRNPDNRFPLLARIDGPLKRGGRSNLNPSRTLDKLVVGRISQMTDPALDSERHTFDLRAPLGRVLPVRELPLRVEGEKLKLTSSTPPVRWIYPLLFSDMSIGALSTRAWEAIALACAYLNEQCHMPVRMCSGEGGMPAGHSK
ncbi:MAG: 4Fe-4S binding protein [Desulfovibrio sp.]|nr:4Fe-4S binding protein [Desulfovibrio sp.]